MKKLFVSTIAATAFIVSGAASASVEVAPEQINVSNVDKPGFSAQTQSVSSTFDADVQDKNSLNKFGWNPLEAN